MEARNQLPDQLANLSSGFEAQVRAIPFEHRGRRREAAHRFAHQLLRIASEQEAVEVSEDRFDRQLGPFAGDVSLHLLGRRAATLSSFNGGDAKEVDWTDSLRRRRSSTPRRPFEWPIYDEKVVRVDLLRRDGYYFLKSSSNDPKNLIAFSPMRQPDSPREGDRCTVCDPLGVGLFPSTPLE